MPSVSDYRKYYRDKRIPVIPGSKTPDPSTAYGIGALEISPNEFANYSLAEKKKITRALAKGLNRNIDRLERAGGEEAWQAIPALRALSDKIDTALDRGAWGPGRFDRFGVQGKTDEQLTKQFEIMAQFGHMQTATVTGFNRVNADRIDKIAATLNDTTPGAGDAFRSDYNSFTSAEKRDFWAAVRMIDNDPSLQASLYQKGSGEMISQVAVIFKQGQGVKTPTQILNDYRAKYDPAAYQLMKFKEEHENDISNKGGPRI